MGQWEEVTVIMWTFCPSHIKTTVRAHCQHRMFSEVFFEQQLWICADIVIISCPHSPVSKDKYYSVLIKLLQCIGLCKHSVCGGRIIQIQPAQIEQEFWLLALLHNEWIPFIECLLCVKHCAGYFTNVISLSSQSNPLAVRIVDPFYSWGSWGSERGCYLPKDTIISGGCL